MKVSHALKLPREETSVEFEETAAAHTDGRVLLRDGQRRSTIGVFWLPAPNSQRPGGPWVDIRVRV